MLNVSNLILFAFLGMFMMTVSHFGQLVADNDAASLLNKVSVPKRCSAAFTSGDVNLKLVEYGIFLPFRCACKPPLCVLH